MTNNKKKSFIPPQLFLLLIAYIILVLIYFQKFLFETIEKKFKKFFHTGTKQMEDYMKEY